MKRFAEGMESMKKIPRHKIGRCLSCVKKVHFINGFRDSGILQKTFILINYPTIHSTVNFLNAETDDFHLCNSTNDPITSIRQALKNSY